MRSHGLPRGLSVGGLSGGQFARGWSIAGAHDFLSLLSDFKSDFMSLTSSSFTDPSQPRAVSQAGTAPEVRGFPERRGGSGVVGGRAGSAARAERRQFGSSHHGLSEAGRELAQAIDRYKLNNHRRYITCDEMLTVLHELGYRRSDEGGRAG